MVNKRHLDTKEESHPKARRAGRLPKKSVDVVAVNIAVIREALENPNFNVPCRQMLLGSVENTFSDVVENRHPFVATFVDMYKETVAGIRVDLHADSQKKEERVANADQIKETLTRDLETATSAMEVLKERIEVEGNALTACEKAVDTAELHEMEAQEVVKTAETTQRKTADKQKSLEGTTTAFEEMTESGGDKKKEARVLKAMKELCDPTLLCALAQVWSKSEKGNFDLITLNAARDSLAESAAALQKTAEEKEEAVVEAREAFAEKEVVLQEKVEKKNLAEQVYNSSLEEERELGMKVKEFSRDLKNHDKNVLQWQREMDRARTAETEFKAVETSLELLSVRTDIKPEEVVPLPEAQPDATMEPTEPVVSTTVSPTDAEEAPRSTSVCTPTASPSPVGSPVEELVVPVTPTPVPSGSVSTRAPTPAPTNTPVNHTSQPSALMPTHTYVGTPGDRTAHHTPLTAVSHVTGGSGAPAAAVVTPHLQTPAGWPVAPLMGDGTPFPPHHREAEDEAVVFPHPAAGHPPDSVTAPPVVDSMTKPQQRAFYEQSENLPTPNYGTYHQ